MRKRFAKYAIRYMPPAMIHVLPTKFGHQMQRVWPSLATYEGHWPVVSMVKLFLKYTTEASKNAARRKGKERE